MSITVILAAIAVTTLVLGAVSVGFWVNWANGNRTSTKYRMLLLVPFLLLATGLSTLGMSIGNYNQNVRNTEQACVEQGGALFKSNSNTFCFTEMPVIKMPM